MTVFGLNLLAFCKEHTIPIKKIQTYYISDSEAVTLYDCTVINDILNMPEEYLKYYNSWIKVPGEYTGYWSRTRKMQINGKDITVFCNTRKEVEEAQDIFIFIKKQFGKNANKFDIIWTLTRINKIKLETFLNKYANKW
jgi:hypothetical protein